MTSLNLRGAETQSADSGKCFVRHGWQSVCRSKNLPWLQWCSGCEGLHQKSPVLRRPVPGQTTPHPVDPKSPAAIYLQEKIGKHVYKRLWNINNHNLYSVLIVVPDCPKPCRPAGVWLRTRGGWSPRARNHGHKVGDVWCMCDGPSEDCY